METHLLSMDQNTVNALPPVFAPEPHPPANVARALVDMQGQDQRFINSQLDVRSLLCFGSKRVVEQLQWMPDLPVSTMPDALVLQIAGLLDPPDPAGKDWALLALQMNLGDKENPGSYDR